MTFLIEKGIVTTSLGAMRRFRIDERHNTQVTANASEFSMQQPTPTTKNDTQAPENWIKEMPTSATRRSTNFAKFS